VPRVLNLLNLCIEYCRLFFSGHSVVCSRKGKTKEYRIKSSQQLNTVSNDVTLC